MSPAAVLAAAFPAHDRMLTAEADTGARMAGETFRRRIAIENELRDRYADEDFEHEVRRVMWEQRVDESTAVHVAGASRRLGAKRAARAAA